MDGPGLAILATTQIILDPYRMTQSLPLTTVKLRLVMTRYSLRVVLLKMWLLTRRKLPKLLCTGRYLPKIILLARRELLIGFLVTTVPMKRMATMKISTYVDWVHISSLIEVTS